MIPTILQTLQVPDSPSHRYATSSALQHAPHYLQTLPSLTFTDPTHFSIHRTTITQTELGHNFHEDSFWISVLLSDPFTSGIVSITITILSIPVGNICFGLMDSTSPIPKNDEALGDAVKNSVSLSANGYLNINTPSSNSYQYCPSSLHEGDCVRMEVNLDSTPRTVQFFVNDGTGRCYVSGIPSSVRIGFSVYKQGLSFRIDNISRLSQPTPISDEMKEVKW